MLRSLRTCLGLIVASMLPWMPGALAQEPVPHLALVVGNAAYADAPLPTAANDAGLVARSLSQTGFAVTAAGDVDRSTLDNLFEAFAAQVKAAGPGAIAVVYLAGYGVQFSGDIYILPIGAKVARECRRARRSRLGLRVPAADRGAPGEGARAGLRSRARQSVRAGGHATRGGTGAAPARDGHVARFQRRAGDGRGRRMWRPMVCTPAPCPR